MHACIYLCFVSDGAGGVGLLYVPACICVLVDSSHLRHLDATAEGGGPGGGQPAGGAGAAPKPAQQFKTMMPPKEAQVEEEEEEQEAAPQRPAGAKVAYIQTTHAHAHTPHTYTDPSGAKVKLVSYVCWSHVLCSKCTYVCTYVCVCTYVPASLIGMRMHMCTCACISLCVKSLAAKIYFHAYA